MLVREGIPAKRVSLMLGPINKHNIDGALELMRTFADPNVSAQTFDCPHRVRSEMFTSHTIVSRPQSAGLLRS